MISLEDQMETLVGGGEGEGADKGGETASLTLWLSFSANNFLLRL